MTKRSMPCDSRYREMDYRRGGKDTRRTHSHLKKKRNHLSGEKRGACLLLTMKKSVSKKKEGILYRDEGRRHDRDHGGEKSHKKRGTRSTPCFRKGEGGVLMCGAGKQRGDGTFLKGKSWANAIRPHEKASKKKKRELVQQAQKKTRLLRGKN